MSEQQRSVHACLTCDGTDVETVVLSVMVGLKITEFNV